MKYECMKSELKEEYDKKVGFLHKRLHRKAQADPSFMLMNNLVLPASCKNINGSHGFKSDFQSAGSPRTAQPKSQQDNKRQIYKPLPVNQKPRTSMGNATSPKLPKMAAVNKTMEADDGEKVTKE